MLFYLASLVKYFNNIYLPCIVALMVESLSIYVADTLIEVYTWGRGGRFTVKVEL